MEIKNLQKAAGRILKAIEKQEKIILYGDADLDGASSVIILEETVKNLGGKISAIYFPDRESEGYGITETGLNYLKKFSPALLISLDLGISNFEEAKIAKKLGFEVIIIDHHEILGRLPAAKIVVDPKQKGDRYPFKVLATAGIAFKLAETMFGGKMPEVIRKNFLELVALATIADMMPQEEENRDFIREGIIYLENSWRPAIRVFFAKNQKWWLFKDYDLHQKISKLISILNVRDVENNLPASFRLLISSSDEESQKIIEKLLEKSELRKEKIEEITKEINARLSGKPNEKIIFEGDSKWDYGLISIVASLTSQKYQKPTFIFKKSENQSQGTVRAPHGVNSVELMKKCEKCLLTYGGHPTASGFRAKNENLEKFKECLNKNYNQEKLS